MKKKKVFRYSSIIYIILGLWLCVESGYTQTTPDIPDTPVILNKSEVLSVLQADPSEMKTQLEILFSQPMTSQEVDKLFTPIETTIMIESIEHVWGEYTEGYILKKNETIKKATEKLRLYHETFLLTLLEQENALTEKTNQSFESISGLVNARQELVRSTQNRLSSLAGKGLSFSKIVIKANSTDLHELLSSEAFNGDKWQFIKRKTPSESMHDVSYADNESNEISLSYQKVGDWPFGENPPYNDVWKFAPEQGKIKYDATSHYFLSEFLWEDASGFNSVHSSYEHDILIYSDIDAYVRAGSYWVSNLPKPYLDTTLFDSKAYFTVGTWVATSIATNKLYLTYIFVELIDHSKGPSEGRVQPQLGSWGGKYDDGAFPREEDEIDFCIDMGIEPKWCVFADQTAAATLEYFTEEACLAGRFPFDYNKSTTFYWSKHYDKPHTPAQLSPLNDVTISGTSVSFKWKAVVASKYNLVIATDPNFTNIFGNYYVDASEALLDVSRTITGFPNNGTTYWWRVRAAHPFYWSNWSSVRQFKNQQTGSQPYDPCACTGNPVILYECVIKSGQSYNCSAGTIILKPDFHAQSGSSVTLKP